MKNINSNINITGWKKRWHNRCLWPELKNFIALVESFDACSPAVVEGKQLDKDILNCSLGQTKNRWNKEEFRNQKYTKGWAETTKVNGWDL